MSIPMTTALALAKRAASLPSPAREIEHPLAGEAGKVDPPLEIVELLEAEGLGLERRQRCRRAPSRSASGPPDRT